MSPQDFAVRLLAQLGLTLAPGVAKLRQVSGANLSGQVSLEQLELLDADVLIMAFLTPAQRAAFERNPLFANVPAVKQKRYFATDLETISTLRNPSALGARWLLNQIGPALRIAAAR